MNGVQISGGADEYHVAAILAVVQHVEAQSQAIVRPDNPGRQSAWLRRSRQQAVGTFVPPIVPDPGLNWPRR